MTKPNLLKILNSETRNSKNLDAFFGLFLGYSFILVGIIVWLRWAFRITHLEFNQSIYILMKNARKSPYFNAGMDRAKLT